MKSKVILGLIALLVLIVGISGCTESSSLNTTAFTPLISAMEPVVMNASERMYFDINWGNFNYNNDKNEFEFKGQIPPKIKGKAVLLNKTNTYNHYKYGDLGLIPLDGDIQAADPNSTGTIFVIVSNTTGNAQYTYQNPSDPNAPVDATLNSYQAVIYMFDWPSKQLIGEYYVEYYPPSTASSGQNHFSDTIDLVKSLIEQQNFNSISIKNDTSG